MLEPVIQRLDPKYFTPSEISCCLNNNCSYYFFPFSLEKKQKILGILLSVTVTAVLVLNPDTPLRMLILPVKMVLQQL